MSENESGLGDRLLLHLDSLSLRLSAALSDAETSAILDSMFKDCRAALKGADYARQVHVFLEIAHALSPRPGNARIWSFLREEAATADDARREVMRIAIFELIPEDPIDERDLFCMWELWNDARTKWAVGAAYLMNPHLFDQHSRKYAGHCKGPGIAFPSRSDPRI